MAICDRNDLLCSVRDILTVDQHATLGHVVQPLDQFHERGLARARMPDQADALARGDAHVQVTIQRRALTGVTERHVIEPHLARIDLQRPGARRIRHAHGLGMQLNHFFHFVHGALQVMNVLADITQIAVHDEVRRQHVSDLARRRTPPPPQPQSRRGDGRPNEPQQRELARTALGVKTSSAMRPTRPLIDDPAEPCILAGLRTEGFHNRISAERVSEHTTDARVLRIR